MSIGRGLLLQISHRFPLYNGVTRLFRKRWLFFGNTIVLPRLSIRIISVLSREKEMGSVFSLSKNWEVTGRLKDSL